MFWLALHLPQLSLETVCDALPAPQPPVALLHEHRVVAANRAAAAAGVRPGLKRATALSLLGQLWFAERDPARDAAALQAVAFAALAFTPSVTLHDEHTVLLEVQASLRLFRGPAALRDRLAAALAPLRHQVVMAAAPTALGAAVLAQWQPAGAGDLVLGPHATQPAALQRLLHALPPWALLPRHGPLREATAQALQDMGLQHLGELQALPRSGLARRFGPALLEAADRAAGRRPDPRRWVQAPPVFEAGLELPMRAEHTEPLLAAAGVLLARLLAWAQARQSRVAAFTLRMQHDTRRGAAVPATVLEVALAEPSADAAHLQLLLRERLARCTLAAATLALSLHCSRLVQRPPPEGELFPTRASQDEGLLQLLERLRARLGDEALCGLQAVDDHRPECATRRVPLKALARASTPPAPATRSATQAPALPLARPAWLLPQPVPLAEQGGQPVLDGRPLKLLAGPERLEAGWWDEAPVQRDHWIATDARGVLLWLARSRLPPAPGTPGTPVWPVWHLHGRFG